MSLKNVDFFKFDKKVAEHVADYVNCKVLKREINLAYEKKINEIKASIASLDNLKGAAVLEEKIPEFKAVYEETLKTLVKERDEQIAKQATFELWDADKELKKSVNALVKDGRVAGKDEVSECIVNYFKAVTNYDITETTFLVDIIFSIGDKFDFKTLVASDGAEVDNINKSNVLTMIMTKTFAQMVKVGTIKPQAIPELVREKYAPKKKKATK